MNNIVTLRQGVIVFSQSAAGKLARVELGRVALAADFLFVDLVKFDPQDADRLWVGLRRTAMEPSDIRTTRAVISDDAYEELMIADYAGDAAALAAFGRRLANAFRQGHNWCPFIEEDEEPRKEL